VLEVELTETFVDAPPAPLNSEELATVSELFEEPPTGLEVAGRLDALTILVVVSVELVIVDSDKLLGMARLDEDCATVAVGGDCWPPAEFDAAEELLFRKIAGACEGPTMLGVERSTSTMTAHAMPRSAFSTDLSGNLNSSPPL